MKIGFIILAYDEINTVTKNLEIINANKSISIVIQSDPHNQEHLVDPSTVNHYELLSDIAGSKEKYLKEQQNQLGNMKWKDVKTMTTPARALTRNWRQAANASQEFDVDWWVFLLGDVSISNISGIQKIISKMTKLGKSVGFTRGVGLRAPADHYGIRYIRIQKEDTTDFYPQFFLVKSEFLKNSFFKDIRITSTFEVSTMIGDYLKIFCKTNNLNFWDVSYSICDYPYPKFIEGLHYNPDRVKSPRLFLGIINWFRKQRMRIFYPKKDTIPETPSNYKEWENKANSY